LISDNAHIYGIIATECYVQ